MTDMKASLNFHPVVWTILTGTIFTRAASSMALPFLAIYLSGSQQVNPILVGLTIGLSPLSSTLGGFLGGYLSDRIGRKKVMLTAIVIWSIVYFGFAMADHIAVFMLLNVFNGLCRSFFEPSSQAMMGDLTEARLRKRVFSLRYTAINIGAAGGPLLGVYIASFSSSLPFVITGIMYLLYGIALIIMLNAYPTVQITPEKKLNLSETLTVVASDRILLFFIFGGILVNLGYSQIDSTLPQYLQASFEEGVVLFARLISLNAIMVIILQYPLSVLSEKWSVMNTIMLGCSLFAFGFAGFGLSPSPAWFIVSMVFVTIGEIFVFPSTSVFIDMIAPEGRRGTYFGAAQFRSIGHFTGPILGGWLLMETDGRWLFIIIGLIILSSILFYSLGNSRFKKEKPVAVNCTPIVRHTNLTMEVFSIV